MRRALSSLKYVPAVLCGLLAMGWVVSLPYSIGMKTGIPGWKGQLWTGLDRGDVMFHFSDNVVEPFQWGAYRRPGSEIYSRRCFGQLQFKNYSPGENRFVLPIPLLLTAIFPLACASFSRFRFPLWSYFAWTALIAMELAFYLR